jgi:probable rRNA maturation factor
VEVVVTNAQKDLSIDCDSVKPIIQSVLSLEKRETDFLFIHFITSKKISSLHKKFFDDPSPTDCISFPIDECVLGEVFVSPKAAKLYVKEHGGDVFEETTLYIVHGVLHLLGYDDLSVKDAKLMREAERRHMEVLMKKKKILKKSFRH